jgi:maltose O-acetyltransferase
MKKDRALAGLMWINDMSTRTRGRLWAAALGGGSVNVGDDLKLGGFPALLLSENARLTIGQGVELRRDVEIRGHKGARIVIEDGVRIDRGVRLLATNGSSLVLRKGCRIGIGSVLNGGDDIVVGESCLVSGYVYVQTSMHRHLRNEFIRDQGYDHGAVSLGDDVWLGAHAVIMPGVTIGRGAVVGSNAVVTKDVPEGVVAAGVPARVLRERTH